MINFEISLKIRFVNYASIYFDGINDKYEFLLDFVRNSFMKNYAV